MLKGKTDAGFEFEVNENIGKDFRIVMALRKLNSDEVLAKIEGTYDFAEAVLGKSGLDKIVSYSTKEKGFADAEFIVGQCHEILAYANEQSEEIKK